MVGAAMMLQGSAMKAEGWMDTEAGAMAGEQRILIGTSNPTEASGIGEGIFVASFQNGQVGAPKLAYKVTSPSFLAVPGAGHPVYAVLGGDDGESVAGSVAVTGGSVAETTLTALHKAGSGSGGGCHVSVTKDGTCVFLSNYGGGTVASFKADAAGNLTRASAVHFPPDAHGPVADRQDKSHVHSALVSPGGGYVLVNDLGLDRIHIFKLDHATAKLEPHTPAEWKSAAGAGPRHLIMHANGKWIYCICELDSTVVQLEWDETKGTLTTKSVVQVSPKDVDISKARACEVVLSKDQRFLYASDRRSSESFAVFAVDAKTGALTKVQQKQNPGLEARYITIDPSGKWFLVTNQFSGDVSVFALDTKTGHIGDRVSKVAVAGASCLVFA